ncbi:unnamed protein product, partial [Ectocarpus sp. 12 AP-2014]
LNTWEIKAPHGGRGKGKQRSAEREHKREHRHGRGTERGIRGHAFCPNQDPERQ